MPVLLKKKNKGREGIKIKMESRSRGYERAKEFQQAGQDQSG